MKITKNNPPFDVLPISLSADWTAFTSFGGIFIMIKNGIEVNCLNCNKEFYVAKWKLNLGQGKYCCLKCRYESQKGKEPYNKGVTGKQVAWNKGMKGVYKCPSVSANNKLRIGEKASNWKGEKASYAALHMWVKRHLGKPSVCEHCNQSNAKYWANKSHEYKRELTDWLSLCAKCHGKHDSGENRGIIKKYYNNKLQRI